MIQDMINSDNMNSTESTIPNIFKYFHTKIVTRSSYFACTKQAMPVSFNTLEIRSFWKSPAILTCPLQTNFSWVKFQTEYADWFATMLYFAED